MMYVFDAIAIFLLFGIYGWLHSVLASRRIKVKVTTRFPRFMPYYRLTYNFLALFLFYLLWEFAPEPDIIIYELPAPYDLAIYALQILSLGMLFYTTRFIDGMEFLGVRQIIRGQKGEYNLEDLDEKSSLRIEGPYTYSRHPLYLYSILFLGFRPVMSFFYFFAFIAMVLYFYVGAYYEEKKLLAQFGEQYREYSKSTGKIFPKL